MIKQRVKRTEALLLAMVMVLTGMMLVDGAGGNNEAEAKEKIVYNYPTKKKLGKGYKFKTKYKKTSFQGIIYKNGKVKAKLVLK